MIQIEGYSPIVENAVFIDEDEEPIGIAADGSALREITILSRYVTPSVSDICTYLHDTAQVVAQGLARENPPIWDPRTLALEAYLTSLYSVRKEAFGDIVTLDDEAYEGIVHIATQILDQRDGFPGQVLGIEHGVCSDSMLDQLARNGVPGFHKYQVALHHARANGEPGLVLDIAIPLFGFEEGNPVGGVLPDRDTLLTLVASSPKSHYHQFSLGEDDEDLSTVVVADVYDALSRDFGTVLDIPRLLASRVANRFGPIQIRFGGWEIDLLRRDKGEAQLHNLALVPDVSQRYVRDLTYSTLTMYIRARDEVEKANDSFEIRTTIGGDQGPGSGTPDTGSGDPVLH